MEKLKFLKNLQELGVSFSVGVRTGHGRQDHLATPEELIFVESDPVAAISKILGVSKSEYLGWAEENYNVICA